MAYKIFFTEDALAELENILDFIRADNQSAAEEFGEALLDHIGLLREFPQIGTSVRMRPRYQENDSFPHPHLLSRE